MHLASKTFYKAIRSIASVRCCEWYAMECAKNYFAKIFPLNRPRRSNFRVLLRLWSAVSFGRNYRTSKFTSEIISDRQTLSWMINLPAIFRVHEMSKSLNASHRRLQHRRLFIPNSNHKLSITNDEHEKSPLAFQSYVDPAAFCCPSTLHHPLYSNFSSRRRKGVTITMITNNSVLLRAGLCSRDSSRSSKRSYHK